MSNLFADLPTAAARHEESRETILETPAFRLERTVSRGHATPAEGWYDQDQAEWVLLLTGRAALRFQDAPEPLILGPGDHVLIAAHRRHRVEWTAADEATVWLALHYRPAD